jgi:DoxX
VSIGQASNDRARVPAVFDALFDNPAVDAVYARYGIFLLRVAIGIDWILHALLKTYRGMHTHEALLAKNGITPLLAWPTFSIELIGGCAILLGWYTRQWTAILLVFGRRGLGQMAGGLALLQHRRRLGIPAVLADCPVGSGTCRQRRLRAAVDADCF